MLSVAVSDHRMPTTCGFPNCKFRSRYRGFEDNRHFYRVPKKPAILRHKWLEAIERTEATIVSQVPHGPVLAIVYDTEVINIEMLAQIDTLELIVLTDLSSPVDRNDAVVSLLGSLGVPITVRSPQTDIDATADALFTYIAILSQPVAAPRFKALRESEAAREWSLSVCADSHAGYTWRNSHREIPDGPPLTCPVTPSPRMPQASMMKEPLWEVADKRQSLGEKTLGLVGLVLSAQRSDPDQPGWIQSSSSALGVNNNHASVNYDDDDDHTNTPSNAHSRRVGVSGDGNHVGLALARRSRAFGMRILVYDPYVPEGTAVGFGLQQVGHLSYLLAESDVVSIHWKPRSLSLRSVNIPVERDQVEPVNLDAAFMDAMKKDSILLYLDNDGPLDVKELGARLKDGRLPCVVMLDRVIARLPLHSQAALSELDSVFKLRSANLLTRHSLFNLRRQAATTVLTFLLSKRSDWSELTGHLLSGQQQTQASSVEAGQLKPRKRTAEHRADADHRADSPTHRTCPKRGCGNLGAREAVARESSAPLYRKFVDQTGEQYLRVTSVISDLSVEF
nr:unnamed protein product [Spirometra erinaceieuropaei]